MYLVYESNYKQIANEGGTPTEIIALKKEFDAAVELAKQQLKLYQKDNYVIDENFNGFLEDNDAVVCYVFYREQNNWNECFELVIRKVDLT